MELPTNLADCHAMIERLQHDHDAMKRMLMESCDVFQSRLTDLRSKVGSVDLSIPQPARSWHAAEKSKAKQAENE